VCGRDTPPPDRLPQWRIALQPTAPTNKIKYALRSPGSPLFLPALSGGCLTKSLTSTLAVCPPSPRSPAA
jgi:hypothetical protein